MVRDYINHDNYDKEVTLDKNTILKYYSRKKMKTIYPNHGYVVIGAIGEGRKHRKGELILHGEKHPYFTLEYQKFTSGIDGYIDCGNDEYIAVIKNQLIRNLIWLVILMVIMIGLVLGGVMLMKDKGGIDPNITDYDPNIKLAENADPNSIAIPGYSQITMEAGSDEMYAALWNPETNPCYFRFTIIMESDEEVLYQSGLVPPGKAITAVKIRKILDEGVYPVLIRMETFSLDDGKTPMNSGTSKTTIHAIQRQEE